VAQDLEGTELERLGRYVVLGKLAKGGMAEVLLGRPDGPPDLVKPVIIKKILPHLASDEQFVRMFLAEARLAALISHPNVVAIHELGEDPKSRSYYMVMEFVDGCTLKQILRQARDTADPLSLALAARIIADICGGLDHAHRLSGQDGEPLHLVHRDISLENVLVGFNGRPKLADFGIAKTAAADRLTKNGQIKGKLTYMAPEQVLGRPLDRRADVWALGVGLYWLASGKRPFAAESEIETFAKIVKAQPLPLPDSVDARFAEVVARTLQKRPEDRYGSARELGEALEGWLSASGATVTNVEVKRELERRFPAATDPDRQRLNALLANEAAPVTLLNLTAAQPRNRPGAEAPTLLDRRTVATPSGPTVRLESAPPSRAASAHPAEWRRRAFVALLAVIVGQLGLLAYLELRPRQRTGLVESVSSSSPVAPQPLLPEPVQPTPSQPRQQPSQPIQPPKPMPSRRQAGRPSGPNDLIDPFNGKAPRR
jgi:eukaryotic-like serine/threonine-protein kinase